ncbi:MAG: hypothetical protein OYK82_15420 [Gammaproteobacteria bacterium]|nr:hypothetical protein [Gammaproteobacteria bacterium]
MKASDTVVLIGAPDSGKTNYLGRLWQALQGKAPKLRATQHPDDISYVSDALSHLLQGRFAPRTEKVPDNGGRECLVEVSWEQEGGTREAALVVPDVSGEIWEEAMQTNELPDVWMAKVRQSVGALLFVRVGSSLNKPSLNWVTAGALLQASGPVEDARSEEFQIPTDVQLCEFVRFLEFALGKDAGVERPRVGVLIAAWDIVDEGRAEHGPTAYLRREFPLFASRVAYTSTLDVKVFGLSVVSGDFDDDEFRTQFLDGDIDEFGYVVADPDAEPHRGDVTTPIHWLLDGNARR